MDNISVCVCTYKRPQLLDNLLRNLLTLNTEGLFEYSIIVVDNDLEESAKEIVSFYRNNKKIKIEYFVEKTKNISLARNKAIEKSSGNLVAFIDDDEYPDERWLLELVKTYNRFSCVGVSGPVFPVFQGNPPEWFKKIKYYNFGRDKKTGLVIKDSFHTGSALISKEIFYSKGNYFDPFFGITGGEDTDFFLRMRKNGYNFIWCAEAKVYAFFPFDRCRISWLLKRFLRCGGVYLIIERKGLSYLRKIALIMHHLFYLFAYLFILPLVSFKGKDIFINYLSNIFFEIGFFLANFGYVKSGYR